MQKLQQLEICRTATCQDPNLEAVVAWTQEGKAYLLVEKLKQPVASHEVYLYDDLCFHPMPEQSVFPISYRGKHYWAMPGAVRSYEDDLTAKELLQIEQQDTSL
ncbi:hypothetical protein H6F86_21230 [Phormidium sp. FACHB-592]|uniref:Uncharacterized protein n=1 Tax=Stenomitos frigidus AS-A4 TaxID=2933935 RepID=A0ABV0KEU9_9CYAN|nr:hypothetical protein [Phormidium sp. FACHB-592]MBD2076359.1 hypothetical protein [Phormidium sp. FACHB-592]